MYNAAARPGRVLGLAEASALSTQKIHTHGYHPKRDKRDNYGIVNVARRVRYLERHHLSQFAAQSCTLYSIPRASPPGGQHTEHRQHMACCPSPQYPNPQCHHYHRCVPQQPAADLGSRPRQQTVGGQHPRRGGASRIFTARLPLGSGVMWHTARCVSQEGTTQRRGLHAVLPRRCSFRKRQPCPGGQAVCCCCWCWG